MAGLTLHHKPVEEGRGNADTEFIEAAIQQRRSTQTEFIMSKQITLIQVTVAALLISVGAAHAGPQEVVKLPRVVVTGKAVTIAVLPRVVVVGKTMRDVQVAKIEQLPRVVVTGLSLATQLQQQTLAATKRAIRTI